MKKVSLQADLADAMLALPGATALDAEPALVQRIITWSQERWRTGMGTMHDDLAAARDAELRHAIDVAFRRAAVVPAPCITVKVRAGWVTLNGSVDWEYQRFAAERVVRSQPAVVGVTNHIRVDTALDAGRTTDADLERSAGRR